MDLCVPGATGMYHGRAFHPCDQQQQGCNWERTQTGTRVTSYMNNQPYIQISMSNSLDTDMPQTMSSSDTYSPLASSSQISKKAIRSYLQWQGPAVERASVLSLVAGTRGRQTWFYTQTDLEKWTRNETKHLLTWLWQRHNPRKLPSHWT